MADAKLVLIHTSFGGLQSGRLKSWVHGNRSQKIWTVHYGLKIISWWWLWMGKLIHQFSVAGHGKTSEMQTTNRNARFDTECRACTTENNKVHVVQSVEAHQSIILSHKSILSFICSFIIAVERMPLNSSWHIRHHSFCCFVKWTGNPWDIDRKFMFRVVNLREASPFHLATVYLAGRLCLAWGTSKRPEFRPRRDALDVPPLLQPR
jgi:hypothetical protein